MSEAHPDGPGRDHGPLLGLPRDRADHRRTGGWRGSRLARDRWASWPPAWGSSSLPCCRSIGCDPASTCLTLAPRSTAGRASGARCAATASTGPPRAPGTGAARSPAARISDPCASRSSSSPPCATIPPTRRWPSHRLLVRAGYVRQLGAGIYSLLPLGWKVSHNVEQIIREEMDRIGCQEMEMPVVHPADLWRRERPLLQDRPGDGPLQGPR